MRSRRKTWLLALLLLVVTPAIVGYALLGGRSVRAFDVVRQRWDETLGTESELRERYPARETNAAARNVEREAAALGVAIVPRSEAGEAAPDAAYLRHRDIKGLLGSWFRRQIAREDAAIDEPPAELETFLRGRTDGINRLHETLIDGPEPLWAADVLRMNGPLPNLLGHVDLQKLLLSDALLALRDGDRARGARGLEASWRLNRALAHDPVLIVQLIRISVLKFQLAVLRRAPELDVWRERVRSFDADGEILEALLFEGRHLIGEEFEPPPDAPAARRIVSTLLSPYFDLCRADASERWRRALGEVRELPSLCDPRGGAEAVEVRLHNPWWNTYGAIAVPNPAGLLDRLVEASLSVELMELALDWEAQRRRNGAWPATDGAVPSATCPGNDWLIETDGSRVTFSLRHEFVIDAPQPQIPLRFTLEAPAVAAPSS